MRVTNINSMPSYKGIVSIDTNALKKEIDKAPSQVREAIWGNIHTFKYRLEKQTPDDKRFCISYKTDRECKDKHDPAYYYGTIEVSDRGAAISNRFYLGHSAGSAKDAKTHVISDETVWTQGFKNITDRALNGELDSIAKPLEKLEESNAFQCADWHMHYPEHREKGLVTQKALDEIRQEARKIYVKLRPSIKTQFDRERAAVIIAAFTSCCPDEIKEAYIGNLNTLLDRLDQETPDGKRFYITLNDIHSYPSIGDGEYWGINVRAGISDTSYSEHWGSLYNKPCDWSKGMLIRKMEKGETPYCTTNGFEIYEKQFKPLTDLLLKYANC